MSDANATAIYAGLTSWWRLNTSLLDAHGPNDLVSNVTVAGYGPIKKGNGLLQNSRASVLLANPITFSPSSGHISLGGWVDYDGISTNPYIMGLVRHLGAATQEAMSLFSASGVFSVLGWKDAGFTTYIAEDSSVRSTAYPIRVRARDSAGQVATSDQVLRIAGTGDNPSGKFFLVTTWNNGTLRLYADSVLVATAVVDAVYTNTIAYFQIGAVGYGLSGAGLDEVFLSDSMAYTQAQIDYLYNAGAGVSYPELRAAA